MLGLYFIQEAKCFNRMKDSFPAIGTTHHHYTEKTMTPRRNSSIAKSPHSASMARLRAFLLDEVLSDFMFSVDGNQYDCRVLTNISY